MTSTDERSHLVLKFLVATVVLCCITCKTRSSSAKPKEIVGAEALELDVSEREADEFTKSFYKNPQSERDFGWNLLNQVFRPALVWDDEISKENFRSSEYLPAFLAWYSSEEIAEMLASWGEQKQKEGGFKKISELPIPSESELSALFGDDVKASAEADLELNKITKERLANRRFRLLRDSTLIESDRHSSDVASRLRGRLVPGRETVLYSPSTAKALFKSYKQLVYQCEREIYNKPDKSLKKASRDEILQRFSSKKGTGFLGKNACLERELPIGAAQARVFWSTVGESARLQTVSEVVDWKKLVSSESWPLGNVMKLSAENLKQMFTVTLGNSAVASERVGLVAFHIGVKAPREHFWSTYWWSPDAKEEKFGKDKKWEVYTNSQINEIVSHFNMCTVTRFDPVGAPSFVDAGNEASWCSNPFIESAPRSHLTNCIGCHQHAGSSVDQAQTFSQENQSNGIFPVWGNSRVTTVHPSDFLWSVSTVRSRFMEKLQSKGLTL